MANLQLGDLDAAIEPFSTPATYNQDLPASILLGFAEALSDKASVRLLAFDQRLVDESRSADREALGEDEYGELLDRGAKTMWENLPLVHI